MKVQFGMFWQSYGQQEFEVPDGLSRDEIIQYLKDHWDEVPVPEGEWVNGSEELDIESDISPVDEEGVVQDG